MKVPDLHHLPGAGQPDQHRQQLPLVVGDLHPRPASELATGLLGEVAEHLVGGLGVGEHVVVDGGVTMSMPAVWTLGRPVNRGACHVAALVVVPEHKVPGA